MSWKADSQLVRTHDDGSTNLAIGEPFFLQDICGDYYPQAVLGCRFVYPKSEPEPELSFELMQMYPGHHVVVTLGAKQALHAACHALQLQSDGGFAGLQHRTPCWPTYSSIADLASLPLVEGHHPGFININTTPNNPDGGCNFQSCDVWDAAYATATYGWRDLEAPSHRISVWSAAKMFGCSGVRVGWLVTKDENLAKNAAAYVEMTTSGVPINSQLFVAHILQQTRIDRTRDLLFRAGYRTLSENARTFIELQPHLDEVRGFPMNHMGMFAWFKVKQPTRFQEALDRARVRLLPGWACREKEPGWYRMSLGHRTDVTQQGVLAIKAELEKK